MNANPRIAITRPYPKLLSIDAIEPLIVKVVWAPETRGGRTDIVDLAPVLNSFKAYREVRDEAAFRTVHLIDGGFAIAWLDDEIEMASTTVERLAEESFNADDFQHFIQSNNLTHAEAAAVLGRSRRQIENYLAGEAIPRIVVLACYGFLARKHVRQFTVTVLGDVLQTGTGDALTKMETEISGGASLTKLHSNVPSRQDLEPQTLTA